MNMRDILTRIELRRLQLDLSENALAIRAGLSRDAIRNWRRRLDKGDEKAGLTVAALSAIARELEVTETWLLHGSERARLQDERANAFAEIYENLPEDLKDQAENYLNFLEQQVREKSRISQTRSEEVEF